MDLDTETKAIMTRIEALTMMAGVNAANCGGDAAKAAADLMCAFVLTAMRNGADPDRAIEAMRDHAVAACNDFWGPRGKRLDA